MSNDHHTFAQQDEQRNVIENSGSIAIAGNAEMILQMNMIQLTEEDLSLISAFRPVIISRIEQITSSFYESILRVDKLKEIITKHTTVERLRLTLSNHVIEMFSGKIDEAFIQKVKNCPGASKNRVAAKMVYGSIPESAEHLAENRPRHAK